MSIVAYVIMVGRTPIPSDISKELKPIFSYTDPGNLSLAKTSRLWNVNAFAFRFFFCALPTLNGILLKSYKVKWVRAVARNSLNATPGNCAKDLSQD